MLAQEHHQQMRNTRHGYHRCLLAEAGAQPHPFCVVVVLTYVAIYARLLTKTELAHSVVNW